MEKSPNSSDEESKRTLICRNLPGSVAKRQVLKEHFEKFGEVIKVLVNTEKGAASVEFATHQQAANARNLGSRIQSQEILLSWKKQTLRSNSSGNLSQSKASTSSALFGRALQSAVGPRPPQATRAPVKREPISGGLYDDLPPPSDWNEEEIAGNTFSAPKNKYKWTRETAAASSARGPSTWKGPLLFGKSSQSDSTAASDGPSTSGAKLFGRSLQPKSQLLQSGKINMLSRPIQSKSETSAGGVGNILGKPKLEPTAEATGNPFGKQMPEASAERNKFTWKSVQSKSDTSVSTKTPPLSFAKSLFGKPIPSQSTEDPEAPSLAPSAGPANADGRRSVSPSRRSIMSRLSPARQVPSRSHSPFSQIPTTVLTRASPVPAPSADVADSEDDGASTVIEWIMPPSMSVLRQTPAITCSERQAVLEKREKLMRLGMSKESDISKAKATQGCCPDMCPERERYIREERRRVHAYEMIPGTDSQPQIDHKIAVKEYSRSSADQEEPLPLELRPGHVLAQTMEYLCNNILDIGGDGAWGDWYDFLWNRTRAIRKDITQQHLCSPVAVGLVEKCARFHIYCGARLVEEGAMVFDNKINNENLTKCLQSLKELYADLMKKNVTCESEAEFRAYVVLMNLNEGDTLREVQQLRPEVRNSQQIHFALSAYAALNDRNYVKFFKLVKSTTFLNACILHRYFNQIRYEALKIILKAYSGAKGPALMTFDQLVSVLHFENSEEAGTFLQHYGLVGPSSGANPSLSRDIFVNPEAPLSMTRSPSLVESKLTTSLGEAVYGQPLPPNELKEPTSSFDESGYFIGIIKPPKAKQTESDSQQQSAYLPLTAAVSLPPYDQIPPQVIKDVTKMVILEMTDPDTVSVVNECLNEEVQCLAMHKHWMLKLTHGVVEELCANVVTEVLGEARKELIAQRKVEEKILEGKICDEFVTELVSRVESEEILKIAEEVHKEVKAQLMEKQIAKCAANVNADLIHKHMVCILEELAMEVYHTDVVERLEELENAAERVHSVRCRRFYRRWMTVFRTRTHLRRSMLTFPAAPSLLPLKRNHHFRLSNKSVQISKRTRFSLRAPADLTEELRLSNIQRMVTLAQTNMPLNMTTTLAPVLIANSKGSDYMKLVLSLPPSSSSDVDRKLSNWLTGKFSLGSVPDPGLLSLYNITTEDETRRPSTVRFGICIRRVTDSCDEEDAKLLLGTNMAVILLPVSEDDEPDDSYWVEPRQRLESLLLSKLRELPSIPLVVISPLQVAKEAVQHKLGVYEYIDRGVLSHVRVDRLDSNVGYNRELPVTLQWLVCHRPPPPHLSLTDIKTLIETYVSSNFLSPVYHDLYERHNSDLLHQDVQGTINYFNKVMAALARNIVDEAQYSWPVYEYNNGNVLTEDEVLRILESICLPAFTHSDSDDWHHACNDICAYLDTVTLQYQHLPYGNSESGVLLYARVQNLLAKTESVFTSRCERRFHCPPPLQPFRANVPWTDVVIACIEYAVSLLDENKMVVHLPEVKETDVEFPIGAAAQTYTGTMILALDTAQKLEEEQVMENSFIDLETSIHAAPFSALKIDISDEVNASRHFNKLLESEITSGDMFNITNNISDDEMRDIEFNPGDDKPTLQQMLQDEKERNEQFERYLTSALEQNMAA